jgi:hypothetical protein
MSFLEKEVGKIGTDKPGAAGEEDLHPQTLAEEKAECQEPRAGWGNGRCEMADRKYTNEEIDLFSLRGTK